MLYQSQILRKLDKNKYSVKQDERFRITNKFMYRDETNLCIFIFNWIPSTISGTGQLKKTILRLDPTYPDSDSYFKYQVN